MLTVALLASLSAHAQDVIKLEVVRKGQVGTSAPGLVLLPQVDATAMTARVDCGGAWAEHKGGATAGQRIMLELKTNPGTHSCTGQLSADFADGSSGEMPLDFDIVMLPPLSISIDKAGIDTSARRMQVVLDRAASKVEVEVYGMGGQQLGSGLADAPGHPPNSPIPVEWSAPPGDVLRMVVRGHDSDGFWSELELFPWYYEVPHEDVVFETNQALIRSTESHKLAAAKGEIDAIVAKYGSVAKVNLYVAGYTDSVGGKESNFFLSEKRAASIAQWFEQQGFQGEIWYQGFGERGLIVSTPDEVDEARNRRAAYVVAAEAPPVTPLMPASAWKRIR